ncbi:MAG TPA: phage portal protein, partial [Gaiellales bacterium]|nr:phage portal protein [Gaiellales bacterium]
TVNRCLQLNAQQIATMTLRYRHSHATQGFQPAWVSDPDPAWYPNGITDAVFAAVWSIYAQGDAFLWVTSRYENGYPRTWTVLDAQTMHVEDVGGGRDYRSNGVWLDPDDVIQIQRNPNGGLRGTSAIEAYWPNVQSAYQAEMYAADVYRSTGVNRVALKSARRLDAGQAASLQAQWVEAVSRRLGAPAILPPDLDLLQTLTISPADMMLLESREWDARQIAAAFGVPAMLLNIAVSGGLTYQNPAQLFGLWWRSELMPCAVKVQEALSRWLPRGNWVEFDPSQSIRPDLETLVATYSKLYADGAVTLDEYRAAVLDLPPLAAGDQAAELFEEPGSHGSIGSPPTLEEVLA